MSALGTVLVVCVACYAQATLVFAWLWLYGSRRDVVSIAFSTMTAGATLASLGALFLTADVTRATAELGARFLYVGSLGAGIGLFRVAHELSGVVLPRRLPPLIHITLALGAIVAALGLVHDPASVEAGIARAPAMRPLGAVFLAFAVAVLMFSTYLLSRAAPNRASARWILLGITPAVIATAAEQLGRFWGRQPVFSLVVLGVLVVFVASWVLLRRFAAVGDQLRERAVALEASHTALGRATQDRSKAKHFADIGELSVVLAQEFEAPMGALERSVSALAGTSLEAPEATGLLDQIDEETDYMNRLVGDLLLFAKPLSPERHAVAVSALVEEALDEARTRRFSSPPVDVDVDPSLTLRCEPGAIRRAIAQVVENAIDAASGQAIRVRGARDEDATLRIEITDPGDGMDTQVRTRALEPFFTTRSHATGLGLAIVARVVGSHGGRVSIDSSRGEGTTVTLEFPRGALDG